MDKPKIITDEEKVKNKLNKLKETINKSNCPKAEVMNSIIDLVLSVSRNHLETLGMFEAAKLQCERGIDEQVKEKIEIDSFPGVA